MGDSANGSERVEALGCVVIGRNEGERLRVCLESLVGRVDRLIYVDSGSTDGSVELARRLGARVIDLDLTQPFTAARARNVGYQALRELAPALRFVQFVDGDCAVDPAWLPIAAAFLGDHPEYGAACGRRRERYPQASIFNALCDVEWDTPVGDARSCGGDALMRCEAFDAAGGFDARLIAGEEPELCVRLRARGWKVRRLPDEMTLHDAAIHRVGQWWLRSVRSGFAYAQGYQMHGAPPERHCVAPLRRVVVWAGVLPSVVVLGAVPSGGLTLWLLPAYGVSIFRTYRAMAARGRDRRVAFAYAVGCTVGRFAELQGVLRYAKNRFRGRQAGLIEYKTAAVR